MALQEKLLGQLRPGDTNAASIYSPGVGVTAIIKTIVICNTSSAEALARLFIDDDGTTYDETTALMWDTPIPTDIPFLGYSEPVIRRAPPLVFDALLTMNDLDGNLAVRSSVASALTFTVFGVEIT